MVFTVAGGDGRSAALARALAADGREVRALALERGLSADNGLRLCFDAGRALEGSGCLILPLPVAAGTELFAPLSALRLSLRELAAALEPGTPVTGGRFGACDRAVFREAGCEPDDYVSREDFAWLNAAPTAEGALQTALRERVRMLMGSRCLIIGSGRVASALAPRLCALGGQVTLAARRAGERARLRALGFDTADSAALEGRLGGFDLVFNTVPAAVLGEKALSELPKGALLIELASAPGGVDAEAATRLGLRPIAAQGLPGKLVPVSAGEIIKETVYNILKEKGCPL